MFTGIHEALLDDKNRILLSKSHRLELGENFVVHYWPLTKSLRAYRQEEFRKKVADLGTYDHSATSRDQIVRMWVSTASLNNDCDIQNRFVLSKDLRDAARITERVTMVGMYDCLEIWDSTLYEFYTEWVRPIRTEEEYEAARKQLRHSSLEPIPDFSSGGGR